MDKYVEIDNFEELAALLYENEDTFTTYETLKSFAISKIEDDWLFLAVHILNALDNDPADYYSYDYCMGILETPSAMHDMDDLRDYITCVY